MKLRNDFYKYRNTFRDKFLVHIGSRMFDNKKVIIVLSHSKEKWSLKHTK